MISTVPPHDTALVLLASPVVSTKIWSTVYKECILIISYGIYSVTVILSVYSSRCLITVLWYDVRLLLHGCSVHYILSFEYVLGMRMCIISRE